MSKTVLLRSSSGNDTRMSLMKTYASYVYLANILVGCIMS